MSNIVTVYRYDSQEYFNGETSAQIVDGSILKPEGTTELEPFNISPFSKFHNGSWSLEPTPEALSIGKVSSSERTLHNLELIRILREYASENSSTYAFKNEDGYYFIEKIPEKTEEEKKAIKRAERNAMLQETDCRMLPDFPQTEEEKESYKQYRTYLRNFTEQEEWWEKEIKTYDEWKNLNQQ